GVLLVGLDAHRRWRYGVRRPLLGALLRDAPPHFFAVVIIPLCCYLLSWRAWFGSETSVYRHAVESGLVEDATALAESPLGFLPRADVLQPQPRGRHPHRGAIGRHAGDLVPHRVGAGLWLLQTSPVPGPRVGRPHRRFRRGLPAVAAEHRPPDVPLLCAEPRS